MFPVIASEKKIYKQQTKIKLPKNKVPLSFHGPAIKLREKHKFETDNLAVVFRIERVAALKWRLHCLSLCMRPLFSEVSCVLCAAAVCPSMSGSNRQLFDPISNPWWRLLDTCHPRLYQYHRVCVCVCVCGWVYVFTHRFRYFMSDVFEGV